MAAQFPGLQYDSPTPFTMRQRFALNLGAPLITTTIRALSLTCRHEVQDFEYWNYVQKTQGRAIVALWHESATMAAYHYRDAGIHTLASHSFDAEWAARALLGFGILSIRGSSSSGGGRALKDLAIVLKYGRSVLLTMDGPRGPRRTAKPGVAILAARTGVSIIPHAFFVRPAWRLRSWDRFVISKPFARIVSAYGPAIPPPANTSPIAIEETRLLVEASLNRLYQQLEALPEIADPAPEYPVTDPLYTTTPPETAPRFPKGIDKSDD